MNFKKEDIIIVTGASSGIGRALSLKLNEQGATIIGIGRSKERLEETKQNALNQENFYIEQKDLTENTDVLPEYIKYLKEKYGKFKGLACVAGIKKISNVQMLNKKDIDSIFLTNYTVPMLLTKGFIDKRNNIGKGANVLFVASISGVNPDKGDIIYGSSKAALIAASIAIGKEVFSKGIRCNCISPDWVRTPMYEKQKENLGLLMNKNVSEIIEPDDIAELGAFLMSDKARLINAVNNIIGNNY